MESLTNTDSTTTARTSRLRQAKKAVDSQPSAGKTPESELMEVDEYFDILHKMVDEYYDSIQG